MTAIRPPAVAGVFYPADPAELAAMVQGFMPPAGSDEAVPKAIIAPHAGYIYSGPVAASAYARIRSARDRIRRVVLLGPAHRVGFSGLALSSATGFATPLGEVELDQTAIDAVAKLPQVQVLDEAHRLEHSLEVHLPFLQTLLADFKLVPFVVGEAGPEEVAAVLDRLWGGPETLIVVSTDLSHYHDYDTAVQLDRETSQAIEAGETDRILPDRACGCRPVNGLLMAARRHRLQVTTIDLRNSGDTAGPRDQVVGYGAYVLQ